MSIGFDGKQFFLREDNGRRINLLSIADTFANRSSASLYQNLVPGYGELEKNEKPLTVALLKLLSEKGRLSAEPEAALCILIFQALTRNPHAARILCLGGSAGDLLSEMLSACLQILDMGIQFLVGTDLSDRLPPAGHVLPIHTSLEHFLFPEKTADLLLIDARSLGHAEQILLRGQQALCTDGMGFLLSEDGDLQSTFQRIFRHAMQLSLSGGRLRLFIGWKKKDAEIGKVPCSIWSTASRTRAHLAAERKKLSQILAKVAAGALPISVGIKAARDYCAQLTSDRYMLLRADERCEAARLLEYLIDLRLGQAGGDVQAALAHWLRVFQAG